MQGSVFNLHKMVYSPENDGMSYFYEKLRQQLEKLGLTYNRLQFMAEIQSGTFSQWKAGKRRPSDTDLEKIAGVEELGLELSTLQAWRAIDEMTPDAILKAAMELATRHHGSPEILDKIKKFEKADPDKYEGLKLDALKKAFEIVDRERPNK